MAISLWPPKGAGLAGMGMRGRPRYSPSPHLCGQNSAPQSCCWWLCPPREGLLRLAAPEDGGQLLPPSAASPAATPWLIELIVNRPPSRALVPAPGAPAGAHWHPLPAWSYSRFVPILHPTAWRLWLRISWASGAHPFSFSPCCSGSPGLEAASYPAWLSQSQGWGYPQLPALVWHTS